MAMERRDLARRAASPANVLPAVLTVLAVCLAAALPAAAQGGRPSVPCDENSPFHLCLHHFDVQVFWRIGEASVIATAHELTSDTGYFWFFREENVEVVVKILDGCAVNGHYWLFAAGLTDVEVTISVRNLLGSGDQWESPAGAAFAPIQDTAAFSCEVIDPPPP